MRNFAYAKFRENKSSGNLSFTDVVYSCPSHEFETWQICLLTQFPKIKFSRQFPNLQYFNPRKDNKA